MCGVNMFETMDLELPRLPIEVLNASLESHGVIQFPMTMPFDPKSLQRHPFVPSLQP